MSKFESVKNHLRNNKVTYIACGVTAVVVAGTTCIILKKPSLVSNTAIQILPWKSPQTIEIYVEALGDPGNIIQDLVTGTVYASQNEAARALGVNQGLISRHLAGKLADVKGHTFAKLGKAIVPQVSVPAA